MPRDGEGLEPGHRVASSPHQLDIPIEASYAGPYSILAHRPSNGAAYARGAAVEDSSGGTAAPLASGRAIWAEACRRPWRRGREQRKAIGMHRSVGGGSPLVAWEPRSWPPSRSRAALRIRALGGSARTRRRCLRDDSESPWRIYLRLVRSGSPSAYLWADRHEAAKLAKGGEPAIPEVLAPRFRADAGWHR
jgi:hypothetical protein